jgi:tRNA nucleotidyltransferase (CCA-adding enzyme)
LSWTSDEVVATLPPETAPLVESLIASVGDRGGALYLVGGPVRDLLLQRPVRDVDLLFEPKGRMAVERLARSAAPRGARVEVYDRFGTVRLSTGNASLDLTTARKEHYRHAGALPKVEQGTLEEDLGRRDFSVNALALPLMQGRQAADVIDPFGGRDDLEARTLRVLHGRSFHDDPTRALRAARLSSRLDFFLARRSRAFLRDALRDGAFGAVSGDRLRHEFEKLFDDATRDLDPAQALRRLDEWHVLGSLEPGLCLPRDAVAPVRRLGRSLREPPWRGPRFRRWAAGLAVWIAPLSPSLRRRVLDRLSVRGEWTDRIGGFPTGPLKLREPLAAARGRGSVDGLLGGVHEEELYALHAWTSTPVRRRIVRWAAEDRQRRAPVSGNDLTDLGLSGPAVGRALAAIRVAFLDGAVANREEALALAAELTRSRRTPRKRARKRTPGRRGSDV